MTPTERGKGMPESPHTGSDHLRAELAEAQDYARRTPRWWRWIRARMWEWKERHVTIIEGADGVHLRVHRAREQEARHGD